MFQASFLNREARNDNINNSSMSFSSVRSFSSPDVLQGLLIGHLQMKVVLFWLNKTKTTSIIYMLYLLLVTRTKTNYSPLKKKLKPTKVKFSL